VLRKRRDACEDRPVNRESEDGGKLYIRRDAERRIVSVSREPAPEHEPLRPDDEADLAAFLHRIDPGNALAASDFALIRVIEDLVDVLIEKEVLRLTDLPESAQAKLLSRRRMRSSVRSLRLLGDDDDAL
jgi:hypothetical protein